MTTPTPIDHQIITGQQIKIVIDSYEVTRQGTTSTLEFTTETATVQTHGGPKSYRQGETGTLKTTLLQDWGAPEAEAFLAKLWAKAGQKIQYSMEVNGDTWAGSAIAPRPNVGGAADANLTSELEFPLDGIPTYTPKPVTPALAPTAKGS